MGKKEESKSGMKIKVTSSEKKILPTGHLKFKNTQHILIYFRGQKNLT